MLGECEVGGDAGALSSAEIDETVAAAAHRSRRMLSHCHDTGMPTIAAGHCVALSRPVELATLLEGPSPRTAQRR